MKNVLNPDDARGIIQRISTLTENAKARWGKMTVLQMLPHCTDQFRMAFGEKEVKDVSSGFSRTLLKFLVLYIIPAPKGKAATLPEIDQLIGGTRPGQFERDKAILLNYLQKFLDHPTHQTYSIHGKFGRLSRKEWGRMMWQHLDHHLKQFGK